MDVTVVDVPQLHRFEARVGGELAGFAAYILRDQLVVFTHTEVKPQFEGHGVGGELVRTAVLDMAGRGLAITPQCPFVRSWLADNPDVASTVTVADR